MKRVLQGLLVLVGAAVLYVLIGQFVGSVNNETDFTAEPPPGGSYAVAMAAGLLERELESGWHPSDVISPARVRVDVPAFQLGLKRVLERFTMGAVDHLARSGGASVMDQDLLSARSHLQFNPYSFSFFKNNSSFSHYEQAALALRRYNERLAQKQANFDQRIDNLAYLLGGAATDLGDQASELENITQARGFFSMDARRAYFYTQGMLYGGCMLSKALKEDFKSVLTLQSSVNMYDQALTTTCESATAAPWIVLNGDRRGILPSHLYTLAGEVALIRARWQSVVDAIIGSARP